MNKLLSRLRKLQNLRIGSSPLIILIAAYSAVILNLAIWKYIYNNAVIEGVKSAAFYISMPFLIFALALIAVNLIFIPYIGKVLICVLTIISSVACYMQIAYGVYIDEDMIRNVFETSKREALDLVTLKAAAWTIIFGIIPSILFFAVKVKFGSIKKEFINRLIIFISALIIIGVIAALFYSEYRSFGRAHRQNQIGKLITPSNYIYAVAKYIKRMQLLKREFLILDADAKYDPIDDSQYKVFILIVGETARAKNFSLGGYEKQTNPNLESANDIIWFNSVSSCGTATAISVPCMFSFMPRKDFDVTDARFTENIVDFAHKTGYKVIWENNNDGCKGVCDRVGEINVKDSSSAAKFCDDDYCFDEIFLDGLEEYLSGINQNTFIVFHTVGSHGPKYYKRVPAERRLFSPTCDTALIQDCSKDALVNTYDNTIAYTDFLISETIKTLKKFPRYKSALLYVSDHGESLGEKASSYQAAIATTIKGEIARDSSDGIYLHGMPYAIAPEEQTKIPMILWLSENARTLDKINFECLKNNARSQDYSHDNLFHSILGVLNINTKIYNKELDIFSPCRH